MKRMKKGQGIVWFWLTCLIGVIVVMSMFMVFDTVLFAPTNSLESSLIPLGLNTSSSPYTYMKTNWNLWVIIFLVGWALVLIVRSIVREPDMYMR